MSIPRLPNDVKHLIWDHQQLINGLEAASSASMEFQREVITAAGSNVANAAAKLLRDIPVDEINREKRGLRVKTLKDMGYTTIADLQAASPYALAAVNGISDEGACEIKRIAQKLADQARQGVKIRLSMDDRSPEATALVTAISKLLRSGSISQACGRLLAANRQGISLAIADLAPSQSGLRWMFASSVSKQKAHDAYSYLCSIMSGSYGTESRKILNYINYIRSLPPQDAWADFEKNSIHFFSTLERLCPGILGTDDEVYGLPEDIAKEVQEEKFLQKGLKCQLRRYQEWGVKYILHQEKVLLGDEMGLGKTVQAIAAMVSLRNSGATHFLVVCPASIMENWCREIRKHSEIKAIKVHGSDRELALNEWVKSGGAAVTTYETTWLFQLEDSFRFSMLIVDEAHYIKNPEAQRTANVKKISLHADRLLFLTGTALENNVDEMLSLIAILQPEIAARARGMASLSSAPRFRESIAPVYYRRKREDVLTELPDLIETDEWCALQPEEEMVYEQAILEGRYADARRVSWNMFDLSKSSKAMRMMELVEDAAQDGRKTIVFSFFLDTIQKVAFLAGERCMPVINGSVPPERRQQIIDEFDKAPAGAVLAAQIQAGGTGLNIQSASVVIICEPQFKPSTENQAISRAYRMGQTRNVLVYRLLCEDTVDERITDLLEVKQQSFDAFADESAAANESRELDQKAFGSIIQEEVDRIKAKNTGAAGSPPAPVLHPGAVNPPPAAISVNVSAPGQP